MCLCICECRTALYTHSHILIVYTQIENIGWASTDSEFVLESTGAFTSHADASRHLISGAKRVVVSAPSNDIPMFVMGVNHESYSPDMQVCMGVCIRVCVCVYGVSSRFLSLSYCAFITLINTRRSSPMRVALPTAWRRWPRCCRTSGYECVCVCMGYGVWCIS
jgi:hypothetical protein